MSKQQVDRFQTALWEYYDRSGRHDLPWRQPEVDGRFNPYKILLSEIMLQQTQVQRVIPKYYAFLDAFPNLQTLASAPLGRVLTAWQGLGYNRRAKFLWQAAQQLHTEHHDSFPQTVKGLVKLPGVGRNTAGAIMAYAFDQPVAFIETNIRTVYIHHFFHDRVKVTDAEILSLVEQTLGQHSPRSFYWALMDYGSHLKSTVGNLNKLSSSYAKQAPFSGSKRQIRGQVIRLLTAHAMTIDQLTAAITDPRLTTVLADLTAEQMIEQVAEAYQLS